MAVLWGEGGAFCAGADLKSLAKRGISIPSNRHTHRSLEFPTDASPAVAGGMELALWADCRVMAERSKSP